jgi:hypothetical protein
MRIYYFGELVEDTNDPNFNKTKTEQTSLELEFSEKKEKKSEKREKTGMDSIGDLLKEINLNIDVYRPNKLRNQGQRGGYSRA